MVEALTNEHQLIDLRERLLHTYSEIEQRAITAIKAGNVMENPVETGKKRDT